MIYKQFDETSSIESKSPMAH